MPTKTVPTKIAPNKTNTKKVKASVDSRNGKNGSNNPNEHLVKANKAMTKAWTLIARRQDKRS